VTEKNLLFPQNAPDLTPSDARHRLWPGLAIALLICLGTRLVVWTAAYTGAAGLVQIRTGLEPPIHMREQHIVRELNDPNSPLSREFQRAIAGLQPLLNWDAGHYRGIIEHGYAYEPAPADVPRAQQYNIAFFPLYPWLCRPLAAVLGTPAAMILVANLSALLAAAVLYLYVHRQLDAESALFAVAIVFCWPTACFYSFGYAESLNLLLTIAVLLLADRQRWWLAALVCGLATATRPTAVTLVPVLLLAYWLNTPRRRFGTLLGLGVAASLGVAFYAAHLTYRFGSPAVYFDNFRNWIPELGESQWPHFLRLENIANGFKYLGRAIRQFPTGLMHLTNPIAWNIPLTVALLALSVGGMFRTPRRFWPFLWLGPLIFLQRYAVSGWNTFGVESLARYMMLATPALIVLAIWATRAWKSGVRCMLVAGLLLLEAMWAYRFGAHDWAG
jgi:hypothetical protein